MARRSAFARTRSALAAAAALLQTGLTATPAGAQAGYGVGITTLAHYRDDSVAYYYDLWVAPHPDGRTYAYLGSWQSGLHIIDVTEPTAPVRVRQVFAAGYEDEGVKDVKTAAGGTLVYGGLSSGGIWVLDVTDPRNPVTIDVAVLDGMSSVHNLWADGSWLYAASEAGALTLRIIDATSPSSLVQVAEYAPTGSTWVHDMVVLDGIGYVAALGAGVALVDLSDPSNPIELGHYDVSGYSAHNAWPSADRGYVLTTRETCRSSPPGKLSVLDVRDPAAITPVTEVGVTDNRSISVHNVMVVGDFAYASWYQEGLWVFDVSDPIAPVEVGFLKTYSGDVPTSCWQGAWGVYADGGGLVYGADTREGLWIGRVDAVPQCVPKPLLQPTATVLAGDACDAAPAGPGSGNGGADPGERVELAVELSNHGDAAATALSARVTAAGPGVTVVADTASYGDLAAGASGLPTGPGFELLLDPSGLVCGDSVRLELTLTWSSGASGPHPVELTVGLGEELLRDSFATDLGWTAASTDPSATGQWQRGTPVATNYQPDGCDPRDTDASCAVTEATAIDDSSHDVDGAVVSWTSPPLDLSGYQAATVGYSRWFASSPSRNDDFLRAELWPDPADPVLLEAIPDDVYTWGDAEHRLPPEQLGAATELRFTTLDLPDGSVTEAAVDRVLVTGWRCQPCGEVLTALDPELDGDCGPAGLADPGESVELRLPLRNDSALTAATGVRATIVSAPAGVAVLRALARYPDIDPMATASPAAGHGFVVRLDDAVGCGTSFDLAVEVRTDRQAFAMAVSIEAGSTQVTTAAVFSDSFDLDPEGVVPTGWTAGPAWPALMPRVETDRSIEMQVLSPGVLSPPNAVYIGRDSSSVLPNNIYLERQFDLSAWAAAGRLVVGFHAWHQGYESNEWLSVIAEDATAVPLTLWEGPRGHDSYREDFGRWQRYELELTGHGLDLTQPVAVRFNVYVSGREDTLSEVSDALYIDDVEVRHESAASSCTSCADSGVLLYRVDVATPGPLDPALFVTPGADGISLAAPYYFRGAVPGPDPLDPVVLANAAPIILYQVTDGTTTGVGPLQVVKSGTTVALDF